MKERERVWLLRHVVRVNSRTRYCILGSISRSAISLEESLQDGGARVDNAQQKSVDVVLEVRYLVIAILKQTDETLRFVDNFNEKFASDQYTE